MGNILVARFELQSAPESAGHDRPTGESEPWTTLRRNFFQCPNRISTASFPAVRLATFPMARLRELPLFAPGTKFSARLRRLINIFGWQGKTFDAAHGTLRNRILAFGLNAIVAEVYKAASWFDNKECIVLDYSNTSLVAEHIRDEIRQIGPGMYLGIVYWDKKQDHSLCASISDSHDDPAQPRSPLAESQYRLGAIELVERCIDCPCASGAAVRSIFPSRVRCSCLRDPSQASSRA